MFDEGVAVPWGEGGVGGWETEVGWKGKVGSLGGGLVRLQKLLGEGVDLIGPSYLMGQQGQFDDVEILI